MFIVLAPDTLPASYQHISSNSTYDINREGSHDFATTEGYEDKKYQAVVTSFMDDPFGANYTIYYSTPLLFITH